MLEEVIALKLKELRRQRQLTLEDLAGSTGLSKGMLSKLENKKVSPTIATLSKIARGLEVSVGMFFEEDTPLEAPISLVRACDRETKDSVRTSGPYSYLPLTGLRSRKTLEPFLVTFPPDGKVKPLSENHKGEEFWFVLKGRVRLNYGEQDLDLEAGDSVHFESIVPHAGAALDNDQAKCLVVIGALA